MSVLRSGRDIRIHDNDVLVSGTRANAFGSAFADTVTDPEGNTHRVTATFLA
ncbi:MAG TPA: hypothetical protein VK923_02405 [Euzebyales bacterium]|nr:hypothetical protein [Euzebyales bacterium]